MARQVERCISIFHSQTIPHTAAVSTIWVNMLSRYWRMATGSAEQKELKEQKDAGYILPATGRREKYGKRWSPTNRLVAVRNRVRTRFDDCFTILLDRLELVPPAFHARTVGGLVTILRRALNVSSLNFVRFNLSDSV